jgi:peptide/nickel transport system substrate-binding protein
VAEAIDRSSHVTDVFGDTAILADQMYPQGELPADMATYTPELNPDAVRAIVDSIGPASVEITEPGQDPVQNRMAQLIAADLSAVGIDTTVRTITPEESFEYVSKPDLRSHAFLLYGGPDAWHPDTWARLFYYQQGPLAYFTPENVGDADAILDEALHQTDDATAQQLYSDAGDLYRDTGDFIPIADGKDVIVLRPGLTGVVHDGSQIWFLRLQHLREG